jgi:hypothetical protein
MLARAGFWLASGRGGQARAVALAAAGLAAGGSLLAGEVMSDPDVDSYNVRVGTQTFAGLYQFTTNTLLVETAQAIRAMGSDILKFYLGGTDFKRQYRITLPAAVTNLTSLARDEPSCRQVLDMPFRHYVIWTYCFTPGWWSDGFSAQERSREYAELHAFTSYLLTNFSGTGKTFYLGHWEGDWYLLPNYNTTTNPTATALQGMRDWLNTRQQAVDDAKQATPHSRVQVYLYTEANRVLDARQGQPANNQRVINYVVPYVTNLDFVSWSSYDGQNLSTQELRETLDYMEAMLPTNKAGVIAGKRIFVGEYGWGGSLSISAQEPPTRAYLKRLIDWGCPFALFWQIYNNEPDRVFCLIDPLGHPTPSYNLHQRFINQARLLVARFKQDQGRLPKASEFAALVSPVLERPLPVPASLVVSNGLTAEIQADRATVNGILVQGIYGQEWARWSLFWGKRDAGAAPVDWDSVTPPATNHQYGVAALRVALTNLTPDTRYYFRFYATNANGTAWSSAADSFQTLAGPPPGNAPRVGLSADQQTVSLQWPASAVTYALQATTNLRPPVVWSPVTNVPLSTNDLLRLILPADLPMRFFRLLGS